MICPGERILGYSGATLDRPALTRLRALVARRAIDAVVIYRMDRLARSLIKSASLLEELRSHGVRLVIVTAPELGDAAGDNLMLNILASFAEFEREMIASRIAESRTRLGGAGTTNRRGCAFRLARPICAPNSWFRCRRRRRS